MDTDNHPQGSEGEIILYRTDDGRAEINLRADGGTVWLTQSEIATLFDSTVANINIHIRNIYKDGEHERGGTIKESLIVIEDGRRYKVKVYSLPMILAIGYRGVREGFFRGDGVLFPDLRGARKECVTSVISRTDH